MSRAFTLLLALLLPATTALAQQTLPVDDSASQVLGGSLQLRPPPLTARGVPMYLLSGEIAVRVHLDVAAWQGRQGRIFMRLQEQPGGNLVATWTTRGRLLPGVVRAGERTLVYAGLIDSALLEDTLRLHIDADGRTLPPSEQLHFSFEIDLDSP